MNEKYTVLMSVYRKEKPEYLKAALDSMLKQTLPASEIVLVCDGPLTEGLEAVIAATVLTARQTGASPIVLVRLPENQGLGTALNEGLKYCSQEWVARMDTDDISVLDRCRQQLNYLKTHRRVDVLSGTLAEFEGEALTPEAARVAVKSYKRLPESDAELQKYVRSRNPINHPCVIFRKSKVLEVGGYHPCDLFEDYDLWVRMFQNQCTFANLGETLLYMRVSDMHKRRGGVRYVKAILRFWTQMYRRGVISLPQFLGMTALRIMVSVIPNGLRKAIYDKKLRDC